MTLDSNVSVSFKCPKCKFAKIGNVKSSLQNKNLKCPSCGEYGQLLPVLNNNENESYTSSSWDRNSQIKLLNTLERIAISLESINSRLLINLPVQTIVNNGSVNDQETERPIKTKFVSSTSEITDFLLSRGIRIKNIPSEDASNNEIDLISVYMGTRYELIMKFYERIKTNLNMGTSFMMNLKNETQESLSSICQLANKLHRIAFLEDYHYQKSPKYILTARTSRASKALNFLSGGWLEIFVKCQVQSLISHNLSDIEYSFIANPQIILPNGNDFELDILFRIDKQIFWFEAKTGDYQKHIEKYSKISSIMNLDKDHTYLVVADRTDNLTKSLTELYGINVKSVGEFTHDFEMMLIKKFKDN